METFFFSLSLSLRLAVCSEQKSREDDSDFLRGNEPNRLLLRFSAKFKLGEFGHLGCRVVNHTGRTASRPFLKSGLLGLTIQFKSSTLGLEGQTFGPNAFGLRPTFQPIR